MSIHLVVDGRAAEVEDEGATLLEALRDGAGRAFAQGRVQPPGPVRVLHRAHRRPGHGSRASRPVRRVAGREVVTLAGLDAGEADRLGGGFRPATAPASAGSAPPGSSSAWPGWVAGRAGPLSREDVVDALVGHLCRCTGWQTIVEAALDVPVPANPGAGAGAAGDQAPATGVTAIEAPADGGAGDRGAGHGVPAAGERDLRAAARRASIEGRTRPAGRPGGGPGGGRVRRGHGARRRARGRAGAPAVAGPSARRWRRPGWRRARSRAGERRPSSAGRSRSRLAPGT